MKLQKLLSYVRRAVDGTLVASKTTDAYGVASIDVPAAGIYIVRVAATATKVSIR